ncbi:MAG: hypothetical protein NDJ75_10275 [Thermoanaerobaculia bacterium]|nr:hypothetical protein [Thermoanaerobaculia bacterium]
MRGRVPTCALPVAVAIALLAAACDRGSTLSTPVVPDEAAMPSTAAASNAGGALVFYDEGCALFDKDGVLVPGQSDKYVCTPSANGNITVKCYATVAAPDKAVRWSYASTGAQCGTHCGSSTTKWHETIDTEGNALLTCQFR